MLRVVLDEETGIYDTRSDALYSFGDAVMEALVSGKGPLGPIGVFGLFFGILVRESWKTQSKSGKADTPLRER